MPIFKYKALDYKGSKIQGLVNGFNKSAAAESLQTRGYDIVSIEDTWYAINILRILESLDELLRPDVLQTQGFVPFNYLASFSSILLISVLVRRKFQ